MKTKLILNPFSSRWKAGKRQSEVEKALQASGVSYDIALTEYPNHGITIAKQATENGFDTIIAAGGDGTISEIVNGMLLAENISQLPTLGVMPLGTANDLVTNLGMPTDLYEAANIIAARNIKMLDVCQVNNRYFVNNAGLGLESYISTKQNKITKIQGLFRYLVATMIGIANNPQWQMKIEWDDGKYEGPVTLISIGNCALTGGVFYTVPNADPFDGLLSVTFGSIPTRIKLLGALPMLTRQYDGNITTHPSVRTFNCTWMRVSTTPNTPAHADGEVFDESINRLTYKIHPAKLPIFTL